VIMALASTSPVCVLADAGIGSAAGGSAGRAGRRRTSHPQVYAAATASAAPTWR